MAIHAEIYRYLVHMKNEVGATSNTLVVYRGDLAQFQDYLVKNSVDEDDLIDNNVARSYMRVDDYIQTLIVGGYAPSTVLRKIAVAERIFCIFQY